MPTAPERDPVAPENYQQTRRELAEWMGWRQIADANPFCNSWKNPSGRGVAQNPPDPLNNPAHAWALLCLLRKKGFAVQFGTIIQELLTTEQTCWCHLSFSKWETQAERWEALTRGLDESAALVRAAHAAMVAERQAKETGK